MRLGVHVPIAGGLQEAMTRAEGLGCTAMQMFSRSPRGGTAPQLVEEDATLFDTRRRQADIEPLVVHAPYILNLASPESTLRDGAMVCSPSLKELGCSPLISRRRLLLLRPTFDSSAISQAIRICGLP